MNQNLNMLNELMWSYRAARILHTAVKLKLFTCLAEKSLTCEALAAACSAKPDVLEKVLIACCAMGLLEKDNNRYKNTELSNLYLVEGNPLYQGNIIAHSANVWDFWDALPDEIFIKPKPADPVESHRNFILGMENITMAGRGQIFLDNINLSGRKRLIDIGGGPGTYSILACQTYPDLAATIFDLPETIAITQERIQRANLTDRISVKEGSWETDSFGSGYDVALMSNVLHGPNSQAAMKLKKAYDCLVSGGLLLVQEFLLNDTQTGPLVPTLFNVMVGAYTPKELFAVINSAGFSDIQMVVQNEQIGCSWIQAVKKKAAL